MFQFSSNFKSFVKFFSAEFSVEFSFSCFGRISVVDFRLILLLVLWKLLACLKYLSGVQEANDETLLLAIFFCLQFGPRIRSEGPNSSSRQIVGDSFLVPYCLGLLLPSQLWPNQVPHVISLIFS